MEFKALKNIETAYQQLRRYSMAFLGLCALITVVAVWRSYSFAEKQRQKIYVLDNGKSLMLALSQDLWQNRPVEAREHVKRFHELFFTLAPDKAAIESNVNRAMMLADKSAIAYYRDLSEKGFFNRLVAGNVSQRIVVDSIAGNFNDYPYELRTYARQQIIRESYITERSLASLSTPFVRTTTRRGSLSNDSRYWRIKTSDAMIGKHILKPLCEVKDRALEHLKNYLEQRTPRQRLYIVLTALLLFAAVDIWMIVSSLSGHSEPLPAQHIEVSVPLKP